MADAHMGYGPGAAPSTTESLRTYSIVVYALYLLGLPSGGISTLIGVIVAYVKRNESRGTPFESHFTNAIDVFWVGLVVGIVGLILWPLFFLGALIHCALVVWILFRTIKGLIRAIDGQPYI